MSGEPYVTYIKNTGLTLNIEVTTALSIGSVASQTYEFRVRAYNPLDKYKVAYAPVAITIEHECSG